VIAASVDNTDKAEEMVQEFGIDFPVGYNLSTIEISEATGAFYDIEGGYLHAAGFIIDPEGKVANAVYSTGPIGRLAAKDCLGWISFKMSQ